METVESAGWYNRLSGLWNSWTSTLKLNNGGGGKNKNGNLQGGGSRRNTAQVPNVNGDINVNSQTLPRKTGNGRFVNSDICDDHGQHHSRTLDRSFKNKITNRTVDRQLDNGNSLDVYLAKCEPQRIDNFGQNFFPVVDYSENCIMSEYIGSFSVVGDDQNSRAEYVRKQLSQMRDLTRSKPVLLVISLSGVKVCSSNGESVYMAHALKRISYATCDPECCQFSFLAREPKGDTSQQYCHAFITKSPEEAEELNTIVANAFKMAYAYQRQQQEQQPTFNELIEQQIEEQKVRYEEYHQEKQKNLEKKLSQISTPTVEERVKERKERRRKEMEQLEKAREMSRLIGKERMSWAKHIVGRTKHKLPFVDEIPDGPDNMGTPGSQNSPPICDSPGLFHSPPSSASTVLSLRQALDAQELRGHGSPVMALKETIDNHFNGQVNSINVEVHANAQDGETYLYPVSSSSSQEQTELGTENSPRHAEIANRPLPATPNGDEKTKKKAKKDRKTSPKGEKSKESRKSWILGTHKPDKSEDNLGQGHLSPQNQKGTLNGHDTQRSVASRYQNDSPLHQRTDLDQIDGDVYAGPPTPKRASKPSVIYKNKYIDRYDSLRKGEGSWLPLEEEDPSLKQSVWYQAGIPREIALEILSQQEIGHFIVRDSTTHPGCYALSVKVPKFDNPTGISHYLILRTARGGVKLKGLDKEWPTLTALVTHHTVMPEMLPCTLRLPRNSSNPAFKDSDKDDKEEDEDYQKLSDFSSMMADLKM